MATLAYRIISYWLPIFVGPFAYFAFRLRYGKPGRMASGDATAAVARRRERPWPRAERLAVVELRAVGVTGEPAGGPRV